MTRSTRVEQSVIFAALCLACAGLLGSWLPPAWAADEEIVARVGGEVITLEEFREDLRVRYALEPRPDGRLLPPAADFQEKTLREVIDARILRILARDSGTTVTEEERQRVFEQGVAALPAEEGLEEFLARQGWTLDELHEQLEGRLLIDKFVAEATKDIEISDEELRQAYEHMKKAGLAVRRTPTTDLAHILIAVDSKDAASSLAAKAKLVKAKARIDGGESFEDVAREIFEDAASGPGGGAYQEVPPGALPPQVAAQIGGLEVGEVSGPFQSPRGWNIVKLLGRNEPGEMPYERVREDARRTLFEYKGKELLAGLIADAKKTIKVEILLDKPEAPETGALPETTGEDESNGEPAEQAQH